MSTTDRIAAILTENGIEWGEPGGIGDSLFNLFEVEEQRIAEAIRKHVEAMRTYTIPGAANNFGTGWEHALGLMTRDADFIAHRITQTRSA